MISKQTTLDLNGPVIEIVQEPVSVGIVTNGSSVTFSGIATISYPTQTPSNPAESTGSFVYQWYDSNGPLSDGDRDNLDDTITTFNGVGTTTLSISNVLYVQDNSNQYYLSVDYIPSAYGTSPITAGTARSTGNAINEPFFSERASLSIYSEIDIFLQPREILDGSTDDFSIFNVNATTLDPEEDNLLSYQWRLNGNNLSDSADISGSQTNQLSIRQEPGTYTIDVVVSHPNTLPSSVASTAVTYIAQIPRQLLVIEEVDLVTGAVTTNSSVDLLPENTSVTTSATSSQKIKYIYSPERDLDAVIEMTAASGDSFSGVQGGQGGWGLFRITLKKGVEYAIFLGSSSTSFNTYGGRVTGGNGGAGGGGSFFYEKNKLIAALGGGGGASSGGAGGDGGGFNLVGQNGFGRNGGAGGRTGPSGNGSGQDRFTANVNGGIVGTCPIGGDLQGNSYFRSIGISDCTDYTTSGRLTNGESGLEYQGSVNLNRGIKSGVGGRINGGWGVNGAGGGGGGGARGGNGSGGNLSAGGGGSGYVDSGRVQVLKTSSGVYSGNGYINVKLYRPEEALPNPPTSAPLNYTIVAWNDVRNPGYKIAYNTNDQSVPGSFISGPAGSIASPPTNYATLFSNYRSGPAGSGIYFSPINDPDNISYVNFFLKIPRFGPRAGSTIYLTSNRGNRDPNRGRVRKWYGTVSQAINDPDLYTFRIGEAFVPFRVDFELVLQFSGNGRYTYLTYTKSETWTDFSYKDIRFSHSELVDANPELGGRGRLNPPDYFERDYKYPRITSITTKIYDLDLFNPPANTISMFSTCDVTRNTAQNYDGNYTEYGKYIIT
jgi:hypothetical protein